MSLHRITRFAGRPLLMTPEAALELAQRARSIDPRLLSRPRAPLAERTRDVMARLGLVKGKAAIDGESLDLIDDGPLEPQGYTPRYCGEAEHEGYGWALHDGIACLEIEGALLDRGFESISGAMYWGYDTIGQALREAHADHRVKAIFVRMATPGGVVAGALEALTADIRTMRETGNANGKPIWVYADLMCSAGFWIGAQADRILAPAVGIVGSVGAVIAHEDWSGAYEKAGVVVTPVQFGAKKTDGAHFKPLGDAARADLQAEIDDVGLRFVADVQRGREILGEQALINTQAAVYLAGHSDAARSGLALGLVDAIASEAEAFAALKAHVAAAPIVPSAPQRAPARGDAAKPGAPIETSTENTNMRTTTIARIKSALSRKASTSDEKLDAIRKILDEEENAEAEDEQEETKAEDEEDAAAEDEQEETKAEEEEDTSAEDEAPAEEDEEKSGAKKNAKAIATADAILALPEANGREKLAAKLAVRGTSVADAKELLAAAPKQSRLVGNVHDPKLGAPPAAPKASTEDEKAADFVVKCAALASGKS